MGYEALVLRDSIAQGKRLVTVQATFPRMVLAEMNTHRDFSRNSASSRAIPVDKQIARVRNDPFVPAAFGKNQKGMQAGEDLDQEANERALAAWERIRQCVLTESKEMADNGVHKQWANRPLELFGWHTAIITATEWANFYALRCHPMASPEIRTIAEMMCAAMDASVPTELKMGEWHLPLVDRTIDMALLLEAKATRAPVEVMLAMLSIARCARVSYLTHEGLRDVLADFVLYDRLAMAGHMSPLEHAAKVASMEEFKKYAYWMWNEELEAFVPVRIGNLSVPWLQHRKMVPGEAVFSSFSKEGT